MNLKQTLFNLCAAGLMAGLLTGCASTKATDRHQLVTGKIAKPATIWVYNFASTTNELPPGSTFADADTVPQSEKAKKMSEEVGIVIATNLVAEINATGMSAKLFTPEVHVAVNDLMIQGYLLTVDEGSATKRVLLGFGDGESKTTVAVEGYQMTKTGVRKLGYGSVDASGSKSPGVALGAVAFLATKNPVGLIVSGGMHLYGEKTGSSTVEGRAKATAKEIADVLKKRFEEQGWVKSQPAHRF